MGIFAEGVAAALIMALAVASMAPPEGGPMRAGQGPAAPRARAVAEARAGAPVIAVALEAPRRGG